MGRGRDPAQRGRGAAEEAAESRGKMAVAGKSGIERDGGEIVAAVEHGIQRMRQPLMQDIVVDRGADLSRNTWQRWNGDRFATLASRATFHFRDGASATASLTRSSARVRRACAEGRTAGLPVRTDLSAMSSSSSPSASVSNSSASARSSRAHNRLRSIMALAGSRPFDVRVSPSPRANCSGARSSPNRKEMARSPMRAGKADAVGGVGGKEHGVAWRADHMPSGRIVLRKHAADRQRDRIQVLPLDVAARVRRRTGLEQADLQRLAFKQCFTADFQGLNPWLDPGILTQVHGGGFLL